MGERIIKVSTSFPNWPLIRQTPKGEGVWGNCKFIINKPIQECDYWVVYEDLLRTEEVVCPIKNTLLITGEPPSIKKYGKDFLNQFSNIITCQKDIKHKGVTYVQQALPWHVGRSLEETRPDSMNKCYDELKKTERFNKTKLMSVVVSGKRSTKGHRARLTFVEHLKRRFGDRLDVFGQGGRPIDDKWDAIADYKYHIVIENSSCEDYWTEKLADAFLGGAYPFYFGCKNIHKYFSSKALTAIDISKVEDSIKLIEREILDLRYEGSVKNIDLARNLILDKYNVFPVIHSAITPSIYNEDKSKIKIVEQSKFNTKKSFFRKYFARMAR